MSGSNYPPGVTGNEWEIAGYPDCGACAHGSDMHREAPALEQRETCDADGCECEGYTPYSDHDEYEPDLEAET